VRNDILFSVFQKHTTLGPLRFLRDLRGKNFFGTKSDLKRFIQAERLIMKCKQVRKRISQYLDDELVLDEKEAFALHIQDCAACRKALEENRAVSTMFADADRYSAPYGFATRVMANLEEQDQTWLRRIPGFGPYILRTAE